uniref:Putative secreted protein n=1 Tax=Ixodes scapularis TaxID=6945 RepID=A0A4D5S1E1_IXOSC
MWLVKYMYFSLNIPQVPGICFSLCRCTMCKYDKLNSTQRLMFEYLTHKRYSVLCFVSGIDTFYVSLRLLL